LTLALKELEGEHSGLNQARVILKVINDFGIRNKLGYFVMDNASSNGTLIKAVADSLALDNIAYDSDHRRLRCNGHIINLVVQAFLFGAEEDDHEEPNENTISPSEAQLDH